MGSVYSSVFSEPSCVCDVVFDSSLGEILSVYNFKYLFCSSLLEFSSRLCYTFGDCLSPRGWSVIVIVFQSLLLLFSFGGFCCCVFKLRNSSLGHVQSTGNSIKGILQSQCFLSTAFLSGSFLGFPSLLTLPTCSCRLSASPLEPRAY